jgi:hypothetical protein
MASLTPRASGFWTDSRMSYFPDDVEEQQNLIPGGDPTIDGRTPLDKTIDRIGMGAFTCLTRGFPSQIRDCCCIRELPVDIAVSMWVR